MSRIPRIPPLIGLLGLTLALGLTSVATTAQQSPVSTDKAAAGARPTRPSPEEQTSRMKQALNLNDDQTGKVAAINRRFAESSRTLRDKDRAQRRSEMATLLEQRNHEMKAVLNKEQYAKFLEHQRAMREHMQDSRRRRGSPLDPD